MSFRLLAFATLVFIGLTGVHLADEPAPAKAKPEQGANFQFDQAKALRLAKLLENLQVLNELNVNDDSYARLEDVKAQERLSESQQADSFSREMKATQDLPAAEKAERMRLFPQAYLAARNAAGESFAVQRFGLLSGPQIERLSQVDLQDQGIAAFFAEDVAAALKLSADQQQQMETIQAAYEAKFRPLIKSLIYTEAAVVRSTQPAIIELVKERTAKVEQVLGKEQLEKLAELRGKPFELSRMGRALGEMIDRDLTRQRFSPLLQSLLSFDAVRKELKLSPEGEAGIAAAIAKRQDAILEQSRSLQAKNAEGEKLSAVQRALQIEEQSTSRMIKFQQIEKDFSAELNKHLKDSHLTRLKQINLQRGARYAIGFGDRDELGITMDQTQKIMSIQMDNNRRQMEFATPPLAQNPEAAREFFAKQMQRRKEQQAKEDAQLMEVLTPEQRQKLKELQGPPFDVSLLDGMRMIPSRPAPPASPPAVEKPKQP